MGIREFLFGAPQRKASVIGLPATEQPDKALEKAFDDATLLSVYRDDAWPYILANKVAEQAAQAPLRIGTPGPDGDWEWAPETDPVQRLLKRPNPQHDGGDFVHLLMLYMEIVGHAPIEIVRDRVGRPGELWLHNPGPWRIVPAADGSILGYLYLLDRREVAWTPDQMTYTRWPDPNNRWYGQGRIAAVRQEVMAEEYASVRDKKLEKNLGIPPGILTSEMPLGETTARELQMRWSQLVGGYQNAGKVGVLGSKTTYQPVQLNAVDADWYKARGWRLEALAAAFGIPMPLIRMEGATFSNAEQARAEFWEGTLQPRLNRIARMLTARLLPILGIDGMELRFDYSQIEALGENDKEAAETAKLWAESGGATVDEIRQRLNLPPHDDPEIGARLLVPSSLTLKSAEEITNPPQPPPQLPPGAPQPPPKLPATNGDDQKTLFTVEQQRRHGKANGEAQDEDANRDQDFHRSEHTTRKAARDREAVLSPVREAWNRDLSSYFTAQLGAILGAMSKSRKAALDPDDIDRISQVVFLTRFVERLKRISEAPISTSQALGAADAAAALGLELSLDIAAQESATSLISARLVTQVSETTRDAIRETLQAAVRDGLSNTETRAKLSTLFDGYQDWRLDRISRTETTSAYNLGSIAQYREAGVKLVTVVDGDGDAICAEWNGRENVPLDEAQGAPLGHPNCTRTFIAQTEGLL